MPPLSLEVFKPTPKTETEIREESLVRLLEQTAFLNAKALVPKDTHSMEHDRSRKSASAFYQTEHQTGTSMYTEAFLMGVEYPEGDHILLFMRGAMDTSTGMVSQEVYRENTPLWRVKLLPPQKVIIPTADDKNSDESSPYQADYNNRQRIELLEKVVDTIDLIRQATIAQQSATQPVVS